MVTLISAIPCPVFIHITVRPGLIYNNLIAIIDVIVAVTGRQGITIYPIIPFIVYILTTGHIIESINIRQIIILYMIVSNRAPDWLRTDIGIEADPQLGTSRLTY
jgi:hypothetical protein